MYWKNFESQYLITAQNSDRPLSFQGGHWHVFNIPLSFRPNKNILLIAKKVL